MPDDRANPETDATTTKRETPKAAVVELVPAAPAAAAVGASLARGIQRMRGCDEGARRGDADGVHRLRTSTRRLRSELRAFRKLVEADWARPLADELKWLAGKLGDVRDRDVLRDRLGAAAVDSREALGPLFGALDERHARASEALRGAFQDERYGALLARIADASANLPALKDDAWQPCRTVLPSLVADIWKAVAKRGRALGPTDEDGDFHEVRKRAKRARYAAEAVAEALDTALAKDARRFARLATRVQDVLGEHQDAVVAAQEIARVAAEHSHDGPFNLAAGRLLERQAVAAERARARFFKVWERFDRKKNRRWLKP